MTAPAENTSAPSGDLKQKKYVVAFLDILGASEKMTSPEESDKFLQQINDLYTKRVKYLGSEKTENIKLKRLRNRIFSDNIVIAQECKQHSFLPELYRVINRSAFIQAIALRQGIFLRGAITHGDFFISNTFVYGQALVDAYKMESERAKYPRIIIDERMFGDVRYPAEDQRIAYGKFLRRDFDGEYFLNFARFYILPKSSAHSIANLRQAARRILEAFEQHNTRCDVRQKYYWLIKRFNMFCEEAGFSEQSIVFDDGSNLCDSEFFDHKSDK